MGRLQLDLRVLTDDEAQSIHNAAVAVLGKTGVYIEHKRMLDYLSALGATVDQNTVRFSEELIERCLNAQVKKANDCENQIYADPWRLETFKIPCEEMGLNTHIFCVNIMDRIDDQIRSATLRDLEESVMVGNTLKLLHEMGPLVVPCDVPTNMNDAYMWHALLKRSNKRVSGEIFNLHSIPYILEMCYLRTGGKKGFDKDPWVVYPCFYTGALKYSEEALDIGFAAHDHGIPVRFGCTMGVAGMSSPITLAGALTSATAEGLAGIVMAEAVGGNSAGSLGSAISFHQGNGTALYQSPEKELMTYAVRDMARIYGFRDWRAFGGHSCSTDSCFPGLQAGAEKGFSALFAAMSGTISSHCGMLSPELACIPLMLADNEIIQMVNRMIQGIKVDEETIAEELIIDRGVAGNFLDINSEDAVEFSARHFRSENWIPRLFVRERPLRWSDIKTDLYQNAKNQVAKILSEPQSPPLGEAETRELDRILDKCKESCK